MTILIYPLFFLLFLIYTYKRDGYGGSTFLIFIYFISSVSSILLIYHYRQYSADAINLEAVLYHLLILFLFLYPVSNIVGHDVKAYKEIPISVLKIVGWAMIIICIPSLLLSSLHTYQTLSSRDFNLGSVRQDFYLDNLTTYSGSFDYSGVLGSLSLFSFIPFFYFMRIKGKYKTIKTLLFLSSFNLITQNLRAMSRDGFAIWLFLFTYSYIIFRESLPTPSKKHIKRIFVIIATIIVTFFIAITVSRSATSSYGSAFQDPVYFFLDYLGQPFINFSLKYTNHLVSDNVFGTFVKSLYGKYGGWTTFSLAVLFFIFWAVFYKGKKKYYYDLNISFLIFYYFSFGVLYEHWYFSNRAYRGSMLIFVLFSFLLTRIKILKHGKSYNKKESEYAIRV
jgi:hypothetical protein